MNDGSGLVETMGPAIGPDPDIARAENAGLSGSAPGAVAQTARLKRSGVEISVVIPGRNEGANIALLVGEIAQALAERAFEIVVVDDGSTDNMREVLVRLRQDLPQLRILAHRKNAGQSRAIWTGAQAAKGVWLVTLDGDGQNDPADMVGMLSQISRSDAPDRLAMVQGQRSLRRDSASKVWASKMANGLRGFLLKDEARDSGCGLRVIRADILRSLPFFDHMHRFMPALVRAEGYIVEYRNVGHRQRLHGQSNYTNWGRLLAGLSDLWGVMWLTARRRPFGGVDEY